MERSQAGALARDVALLNDVGTVAGMSDTELLRRFLGHRGGAAEVAFTAIVARHGPMVLEVCRRILREPNDADDAFQATFLVLVRKADSVRVAESLGPWLYGVAYRVAVKARANAGKRRRREGQGGEALEMAVEDGGWDARSIGVPSILLEELGRLPDKYRDPVVLCYLQGLTHDEAAQRLRWPVGTLSGRLSRARDLLRGRLTRRGLGPGAAVVAAVLESREASAVPPRLVAAVTRLPSALAAGGLIPLSVLTLTQGVLKTMALKNLKYGLCITSAVVGITLGTGYVIGQVQPPTPAASRPTPTASPASNAQAASEPAITLISNRHLTNDFEPMIPGFPKFSETRRKEWEELKRTRQILHGVPPTRSLWKTETMIERPRYIAVLSTDGSSLSVLSMVGGIWESYTAPPGVHAIPIEGEDLLAIGVSGPSIRELAVYSAVSGGKWYTQAIRELASGEFFPFVQGHLVIYPLGNDLYAFSSQAGKWGALHLTGTEKPSWRFSAESLIVQQGNRLYVYRARLGEWSPGVPAMRPEAAQ